MNWESDISAEAQKIMEELGHFGPTVNIADATVKGWMYDDEIASVCKTYWTSGELRKIAAACNEVADWLDKRAKEGE